MLHMLAYWRVQAGKTTGDNAPGNNISRSCAVELQRYRSWFSNRVAMLAATLWPLTFLTCLSISFMIASRVPFIRGSRRAPWGYSWDHSTPCLRRLSLHCWLYDLHVIHQARRSRSTVYIVSIRASEDNRLSGEVTSFFRWFMWFETGLGHGAYHLCQNSCFVFLEELRPWIIKVDDDWL